MKKARMTKVEKDFFRKVLKLIEQKQTDQITSFEWNLFAELYTEKTL